MNQPSMELLFNVIFVPGTVRLLRLGVLSMLVHSPYRFRLVANGLGGRERDALAALAERSPRLEFFDYPARRVVPHATMLNVLAERDDGPFFCAMDNDVFAMEPFADQLNQRLGACDLFSSCYNLAMDPAAAGPGFDGNHLHTPGGLPLATTFFFAWRRSVLRAVMERTGIGFELYQGQRYLPPYVLAHDWPDDLRAASLDTGKLLCIVASRFGARMVYEDLPALAHVGSVSATRRRWYRGATWVERLLRRPFVLRQRNVDREATQRARNMAKRQPDGVANGLTHDRLVTRGYQQAIRRGVALYFQRFLWSLDCRTPPPRLELADAALVAKLQRLCAMIRDLHARDMSGVPLG